MRYKYGVDTKGKPSNHVHCAECGRLVDFRHTRPHKNEQGFIEVRCKSCLGVGKGMGS